MIAGLRSYSAYKDSGVSWLGEVPAHWDIRRTKTLLAERSEKGFPNEPLLAATQTKGVVRKEHYENRTVLALKDLHLLKVVHVGDFVISLRSFQGGTAGSSMRGIAELSALPTRFCIQLNEITMPICLGSSSQNPTSLTCHYSLQAFAKARI